MVNVLLSEKTHTVDLSVLPFSKKGTLDKRKIVKRELMEVVDSLTPGKLCVVQEVHVNGGSSWKNRSLFKVGERGIVSHSEKGNQALIGIDVESSFNPSLKIHQKVVFRTNPYEFQHRRNFVNLSLGGVSDFESWNEGTFSPAGGHVVHHPFGGYVNLINLDQIKIETEFKTQISELELRLKSIPFILPRQYYSQVYSGISFGSLDETAVNCMLEVFTEREYLEKVLSREEVRELYNSRSHKNISDKEFAKKTDLLAKNEKNVGVRKELFEVGKEKFRDAMIRNITLNAIGSFFENGFRYCESGNRLIFCEINQEYPKVDGTYEPQPRRKFEFIPSSIINGLVYTIPQCERSAKYLLGKLGEFNTKYPDTRHHPDYSENFVPESRQALN